MKKPNKVIKPDLKLSVQFTVPAEDLTRQRIRGWVSQTLNLAWMHHHIDANGLYLNLRFVDSAEGQTLNQQFRQKNNATNVLTFAYGLDDDNTLTADVVICVPVLVEEAQAQHKLFISHAAHLIIHGTLHALGFDHIDEAEANEMETLEKDILARLKIADPYAISDKIQ